MKSEARKNTGLILVIVFLSLAVLALLALRINDWPQTSKEKPELPIMVLSSSSALIGNTMKFDVLIENTFDGISSIEPTFSLQYVKNGISKKQLDFYEDKEQVEIHLELQSEKAEELYEAITTNSVLKFNITQDNGNETWFGVSFK
ncbi:MAG: hypothetical protein GX025_02640 [Clostridiales bacterium]|nr:hypothetical protein [Clostridiales bacterium]